MRRKHYGVYLRLAEHEKSDDDRALLISIFVSPVPELIRSREEEDGVFPVVWELAIRGYFRAEEDSLLAASASARFIATTV